MTINYRGILTLEIIGFPYRSNLPQKSFITLAPGHPVPNTQNKSFKVKEFTKSDQYE
jgi:hypothetical protein